MKAQITSQQLEALIKKGLNDFYEKRLLKLQKLKLRQVLPRKNPYLFRALGTEIASELIDQILRAYISSSDEAIFGNEFFEPIALAVSGGKVSDARGVDFVVETKDRYLAVALKSGPNIFNASQKQRQNDEFNELRSRLMKIHKQFDPLLAHAYGRRSAEPSGKWVYRERSGQQFWTEITGDKDFYVKLIRLMKDIPAQHRKQHAEQWGAAVNRFTVEFARDFCFPDGRINWEKLIEFVSKEGPPESDQSKSNKQS